MSTATATTAARSDHVASHSVNHGHAQHGHGHAHGPTNHHSSHGQGHSNNVHAHPHPHAHNTNSNTISSGSNSDPTPRNNHSNSNGNSTSNVNTGIVTHNNNALTPKTMSSMPLAISHEVATRMLEASRSLNASLHRHKREDKINNNNGDSATTSGNGNLLAVASQCDNALLQAHLKQMKREDLTKEETEMCLLLFLDLDKSRKLLRAFQIVECKENGQGSGQEKSSSSGSGSGSVDPILDRERILQMFKCLLMSIKTCIHYDNDGNANESSGSNKAIKLESDNSPRKNNSNSSSEWRLADQTKSDVQEIANFATGQVVEFVLQKKKKSGSTDESSSSSSSSNNQPLQVPFHIFGEWYNAGGFSLVPWLELLDLAKWDYMGRAAATAAAAQAAKEKHQQQAASMRSNGVGGGGSNMNMAQDRNHYGHGRSNSHGHGQRGMKPIVEEGFAVADVFNSPQYKNPAGRQSSQASHPASQPYNSSTTNNSHHPAATASSSSVSGSTSASASSSLPPLFEISFSRSGKYTIPIMEENLRMFQELVQRTDLSRRTPDQVSHVLLRNAKPSSNKNNSDPQQGPPIMVLNRHDFGKCVRDLVPNSSRFSREDMDRFSKFFTIFFLSFMRENDNATLGPDCVNAKELAVGFSFLCTGNKSSKLSATFGILDEGKSGYLTQHNLMRYLHSYLRMLVGISLLTASPRVTVQTLNALLSKESPRISSLCAATDNGSHWILSNFMQKRAPDRKSSMINFEEFAAWYTQGGFTIAPWLEFIDHKKFISLMNESQNSHLQHTHRQPPQSQPQAPPQQQSQSQNKQKVLTPAPPMNPPTSSGKIRSFDEFVAGSPSPTLGNLSQTRPKPPISHGMQEPNPKDVLFTFPLANQRKLIVLREDAAYVRLIVDQLGLLPTSPSGVWTKFFNFVKKNPLDPLPYALTKRHRSGHGLAADSDQNNFVVGVLKSIPAKCKRKRSTPPLPPTPQETLKNFFQSFDLGQVDRVAANQLMGGLTLLCGGNKSEKLSFAFGLFDMRVDDKGKKKKKGADTTKSLCGKELFYFLRSFLIVMFSCCKQSMELRADSVSRYISDTANMVTDDAMKYQWRARKIDRINFDEFGDWYNEGGFEVAPWLELLDLNKWVLLDKAKAEKMMKEAKPMKPTSQNQLRDVSNVQGAHINEDSKHPVKEEQQQQEQQEQQQMSPQNDNVFESCPPSPPNDDDFDNADFFDNMGDGMGDLDFVDNMDAFGIDMDAMETLEIELPTMISGGEAEAIPRQFPQESKSFQFRLMTNGKNNYSIVISQTRVNLLSTIVRECQIADISIVTMCEKMEEAKQGSSLNKERFNGAITNIFIENQATSASKESERMFFSLLSSIFSAFDTKKTDRVEASELMCGLTVLCGGRKSDKLEYTFELLDKNKKGLLSRFQMARYLHSFLTVLLTISSCKLGNEPEEEILFAANGEKVDSSISLPRVIGWVSSWATEEVFKATPKSKKELVDGTECINFDNFADWYTSGGHSSITWLELLDLKKWILSN